jgi:hypothetical protein
MKTVWQGRIAQVAGKHGEHAPMVAALAGIVRVVRRTPTGGSAADA